MPNVLLTQRCVRSCPYCFADKHMSDSSPKDIMSWENLVYIADFLQAGGEKRFPLLGGEPTLHPDFVDIVLYLLERGFDVGVFTSGVMSERTLERATEALQRVPGERLSFVCNMNDPIQTRSPTRETEAVFRFLRRLGDKVVPGFNIYRTDFELDFLFRAINEFGLRRTIRIGLTHPIVGQDNRFIGVADMRAIIDRLFSFKAQFERLRVVPGLDCGFPMCLFSDEQLAWLYRNVGKRYDFGCGPVIDIGPDMMVWACFPLSGMQKKSLFDFDDLGALVASFRDLHDKVRIEAGGIFQECDTCPAREEHNCFGGCLAHALNEFQAEERLRVAEVYI